jgi:hypothetical protein
VLSGDRRLQEVRATPIITPAAKLGETLAQLLLVLTRAVLVWEQHGHAGAVDAGGAAGVGEEQEGEHAPMGARAYRSETIGGFARFGYDLC